MNIQHAVMSDVKPDIAKPHIDFTTVLSINLSIIMKFLNTTKF